MNYGREWESVAPSRTIILTVSQVKYLAVKTKIIRLTYFIGGYIEQFMILHMI